MFKKLFLDEEGAGMVEYVLLIALVAGLVFAAVRLFGTQLQSLFSTSEDMLKSGESEFTH